MRFVPILALLGVLLVAAGAVVLLVPSVASTARSTVRSIVRPEPPAPITPIALTLPPTRVATPPPTRTPLPTATALPTEKPVDTLQPAAPTPPPPPPEPTATPTPLPVVINGRVYDAYIPAASKEGQDYQYSCEFDAAWVILQTFGFAVTVDDLIARQPRDTSIEPYIEETADGALIRGGDISQAFSGDYTSNFLARSTGAAIRPLFEQYGLATVPVADRAGIEHALRGGALIWMKTTVDFKPWRPATWVMPDGRTHQTVLGNDHAVVVMGFNSESVVIRDVLGPTSSNWQRPYEYEVDWATFLACWQAQSFDALAVYPPDTAQQP